MKRLTTDTPDGNFETMLNLIFGKDGWAHIRHDGEEGTVPLTQWAKAQCILHGCGEFFAETPREIDEEISDCLTMDFPDCPVALAYGFAVQACHLRDRLKMYEDICFADDRRERLPLDVLRDLVERTVPSLSSDPLTLDELREIDRSWWEGCAECEAVYGEDDWDCAGFHEYRIVDCYLQYFDHQFGWEGVKIKFCPNCGRPLTEEAWAELERRIGGL